MDQDISQDIAEALSYMDPTDRSEWVKMAFAVKTALGERGFANMGTHGHSRTAAPSTDTTRRPAQLHLEVRQDARQERAGSVNYQTLFKLAWERGWRPSQGNAVFTPRPETKDETAERAQQEQENQRRAQETARRAQRMIENATMGTHPYLQKKGYADMKWMVHGELLLVPMRHCRTNKLQTLQTIAPDGAKKFLPGGIASEAVYRLGHSSKRPIQWFTEGFATGLAVQQAIIKLHRKYDQVVVCFSDGNIPKVVKAAHKQGQGFVIADNDESGAGERAAKAAGLPYWMPPVVQWDAWDWQANHGIDSLVTELRQLVYGERQ